MKEPLRNWRETPEQAEHRQYVERVEPLDQAVKERAARDGAANIHETAKVMNIERKNAEDLPLSLRAARTKIDEAERAKEVADRELRRQIRNLDLYASMKDTLLAATQDVDAAVIQLEALKNSIISMPATLENWPELERRRLGTFFNTFQIIMINERQADFLGPWIDRAKGRLKKMRTDIAAFAKEHNIVEGDEAKLSGGADQP